MRDLLRIEQELSDARGMLGDEVAHARGVGHWPHAVARGTVICWNDVLAPDSDAAALRRVMEAEFAAELGIRR